jgi:arylsulfatase A-like enzyme
VTEQDALARSRSIHVVLRVGTCVTRALPVAFALHALEAVLSMRIDNAATRALPDATFTRYLIGVVLAAGATAFVCGLFCAMLDLVAERLVRVLAPALPGFALGVEALRKLEDVRGPELTWYAATALGLGVLVALWMWLRPPARARLQHDATAWSVLIATVLAAVGAVYVARVDAPQDGDADASLPALVATPRAELPAAKNLVVVLIDTLRADHLSCYGYARETSPRLDAFAKTGVLFEQCMSPKPQTTPAVASLFTGLFPRSTGVVKTMTRLLPELKTLAECTRDAGFVNVGWSANAMITKDFDFDQGFDTLQFVPKANRSEDGADGKLVTLAALERIRELRRDGRRHFAYVHIVEPHSPYTPRPDDLKPFRSDAQYASAPETALPMNSVSYLDGIVKHVWLNQEGGNGKGYIARYDAEIRHADRIVGEFIDALDALGAGEDTAIVVVADHGESMLEHHAWFNHGITTYEGQVHVPLIVRTPGVTPGARRSEVVSLVGLMPTMLDLVGVERSTVNAQEPSFHALLEPGAPTSNDRWTMLSSGYHMQRLAFAIRTDADKLVDNKTRRSPLALCALGTVLRPGKRFELALSRLRDYELDVELYDLRDDPGETRNLAYERPERTALLRRHLERFRSSVKPPKTLPKVLTGDQLSPDLRDDAAGNGYIGGGGRGGAGSADATESEEAEREER